MKLPPKLNNALLSNRYDSRCLETHLYFKEYVLKLSWEIKFKASTNSKQKTVIKNGQAVQPET